MGNSQTFGWAMMAAASLDFVNAALTELYNAGKLPNDVDYTNSNLNITLKANLGAPSLNANVGTQTDAMNVVIPVTSGTLTFGGTNYPLSGTATMTVLLSYVDIEVSGSGTDRQVYVDFTNVLSVDTLSFNLNPELNGILAYMLESYIQQYFKDNNGQAMFTLGTVNINNLSGIFPKGLTPIFAQFASYVDPNNPGSDAIVAMIATDGSPAHGQDPIFTSSVIPSGSQASAYFGGAAVLSNLVVPPAAANLGLSVSNFSITSEPVEAQMQGSFTKKGAKFTTFNTTIDSNQIGFLLKGEKTVVIDYDITGTANITAAIQPDGTNQKIVFTASKPSVSSNVSNTCVRVILDIFSLGLAELFYWIVEGQIKNKVSEAMGDALKSALPSVTWNYTQYASLKSISMPADIIIGVGVNAVSAADVHKMVQANVESEQRVLVAR